MSKKILLADDSITIQKVIELTFSDEDFEVVTVGNGRLAIERVQDVRPDLVLCDIIMPEKDGYEVCDFIKKNPALSRTPVLLLTGAFEPFDQERATRVGCDGFLAKPFEPQTLIAKVKDLLGRAGAAPAAVAAATSAPAPAAATAPQAAPAWTKHPAPVSTSPAPQPEPFAFVPEPPPTHEPPRPAAAAMPFEEAGVSFFTDETFEEIEQEKPAAAPAARTRDTAPVPTFPETPDFAEYRGSAFDEVAPAAPTIALTAPAPPPAPAPAPVAAARPAASGAFPALDEEEGPQTLLHVSSEEMATLRGEPSRPAAAPPPPSPAPAPVPARAPLWTQQTMEVPLETRARVAREAAQAESEPIFEEVFEPAPPPPRPSPPPPAPAVSASRPPAPAALPAPPREPAAAPKPAPVPRAEMSAPPSRPMPAPVPTPAPAPVPAPMAAPAPAMPAPVAAAVASAVAATNAPPARASQQDPETVAVRGAGDGAAVRSSVPSAAAANADAAAANAAGVSVPVDMVSQIAQRVVAQISEKVIREVAWEVIPDLAEVLIKKEIERLKAELQQT
jgi:CheY-like chemotaxis protein